MNKWNEKTWKIKKWYNKEEWSLGYDTAAKHILLWNNNPRIAVSLGWRLHYKQGKAKNNKIIKNIYQDSLQWCYIRGKLMSTVGVHEKH